MKQKRGGPNGVAQKTYSRPFFNVQEGSEGFFFALLLPHHISLKEYQTMTISNPANKNQPATRHSSALEQALHKIDSVDVPEGNSIALAYSGGLDSTLCVKLSQQKYHASSLTAISADVGQGEAEIQESIERAEKLGISPLII